jgi:hypothetical protein
MKQRTIIGILGGVLVGAAIGYYLGLFHGHRQHAVEEVKIAANILGNESDDVVSSQLREYLKGRMYWNSALYLPKSWAVGLVVDYGVVDETILRGVDYRKEPTISHDELAARAHGKIAD